jgi:hypothetical protein
VFLVTVALLAASACTEDDPPALDLDGVDVPVTTSDTLGTCPAGGPDATTPPAGCLSPDGQVQRP